MMVRADAIRLPFPDRTFDMCIGSPPYADARLYLEMDKNLGISLHCKEWVAWMLDATTEALRVTKGPVIWICAGVTRNRNYWPGPEGLLWEWWKRGGECHCMRPVFWHRSGIPGSGGDQGFRCDVEYCLIFKRPGKFPWSDVTANGHPPKYAPGGKMSHRLADGYRVNQWGSKMGRDGKLTSTEPQKDGSRTHMTLKPSHKIMTKDRTKTLKASSKRDQVYEPPALANPGNFFKTNSGYGHMGSNLAHENEAPFPVAVPAWFIASYCPPGGIVIDPFSGSGTTCHAALNLGRRAIGCDLRQSQCLLGKRRLNSVTPSLTFQED